MIIYQIKNKINGMSYIGQTRHDFTTRYRKKWWKTSSSLLLKKDVEKFGIENFEVFILEKDLKSQNQLTLLEKEHIKRANSIFPNGYNLTSGGKSRFFIAKEQREKMAQIKRGVDFIFFKNQLSGEICKVANLEDFAKERNLLTTKLSEVSNGIRKSHRFWTKTDTFLKFWIVENANGKLIKIVDGQQKLFREKFNLTKLQIEKILSGIDSKEWKTLLFSAEKGWNKRVKRTHPSRFKSARYEQIYQNGIDSSSLTFDLSTVDVFS